MISKEEAEDFIEEVALSSDVDEEDILRVRQRIPSKNPHITPLLREVSSIYFLSDEVLSYYCDKLYQLAQK